MSCHPQHQPYALREYQERLVAAALKELTQQRKAKSRPRPSVLATAPTGAGKTVMFGDITRRARERNARIAIMVHRQELIEQAAGALLRQSGINPGIAWKNRREYDAPVCIVSHGSISAPDAQWPVSPPDLLIIDEAHHAKAEGWLKAINRIQPKLLLGFTATPFRFDRNPLSPTPFHTILPGITPTELIDQGVLVPPTIVTPVNTDPEGQPIPIGKAANPAGIYANAVRYALSQGRRKIIIYVSGNRNSKPRAVAANTVKAITNALGIPADSIDDAMSSGKRKAAIARYRNANTAALINYATLTEGVDIPETDCLIIGRNTRSESSLIQMLGRGIRSYPGKTDCLVIDYTGRHDLHEMVHYYRTDEIMDREARKRERREREAEKEKLMAMNSRFPQAIGKLLNWQVRFPWFKPWPEEPLQALSLWTPEAGRKQPYDYIFFRNETNGALTAGALTIRPGNKPPYRMRLKRGLDETSAALLLKQAVKNTAKLERMGRDAPWRHRPATDAQKQYWNRRTGEPASENATFGEISDLLAKDHFTDYIPLKAAR